MVDQPGVGLVNMQGKLMEGRHYLGEAYISRMCASADKTMETAFYDGRCWSFTYKKYCEILIQAFNDVEETGEDVTEERKMRTFLKRLNDPCCEAAKHTIRVTPNLRNSIANAMDLVAEVLGNIASFTNPECCNVSVQESLRALTEGGRGGNRGCGGRGGRGSRGGHGGGRGSNAMFCDDKIVNCYYSPHEWCNRMTDAQRNCARSLHKSGRGQGSGHGQGNWNTSAVSFADPIDDNGQGGEGEHNVSQWTNAQPSPSTRQVATVETHCRV